MIDLFLSVSDTGIVERRKFEFSKQDLNLKSILLVSDVLPLSYQSRTKSPQDLWPEVSRQERLWGTGIFITAGFLR